MTVKKTKKKKPVKAKAKIPVKAKKSVAKRVAKSKSKRPVKAKVSGTKKPVKAIKFEGKPVGKVVHYYTNIGVAVIELSNKLSVGDNIKIKGATSDFTQKVVSMQVEHKKIKEAKKGNSIGLKVKKHAREHDVVYKVE